MNGQVKKRSDLTRWCLDTSTQFHASVCTNSETGYSVWVRTMLNAEDTVEALRGAILGEVMMLRCLIDQVSTASNTEAETFHDMQAEEMVRRLEAYVGLCYTVDPYHKTCLTAYEIHSDTQELQSVAASDSTGTKPVPKPGGAVLHNPLQMTREWRYSALFSDILMPMSRVVGLKKMVRERQRRFVDELDRSTGGEATCTSELLYSEMQACMCSVANSLCAIYYNILSPPVGENAVIYQ